MPDIAPTRSAYLELLDDRRSMQEGYHFLDEKRLILAGEIVAELQGYEQAKESFDELYVAAVASLKAAVQRHGLEGLEVYPALVNPSARVESSSRSVLGVAVTEAHLVVGDGESRPAVFASPEAEHCRLMFLRVLQEATALAALESSLRRLWDEYRRTSRRARALEDVLLPEMDETLRQIDSGLEEQDREEAIRVQHFQKRDQRR
jgi:V/A-type H+-transporting ATPase subunit D